MTAQTVACGLLVWVLASVVVALVIGAFVRVRDGQVPRQAAGLSDLSATIHPSPITAKEPA